MSKVPRSVALMDAWEEILEARQQRQHEHGRREDADAAVLAGRAA
jgi:hypothetical protein